MPGQILPPFTSDLDSLQCLFLAYLAWRTLVRVFVFTTPNVGKIHVFTVNREQEAETTEGRGQGWDFADSIFTHQTGLFPVSTWQNSHSHHLILSFPVLLCPPLWFPFNMLNLSHICYLSPRLLAAAGLLSVSHLCLCLRALRPKHMRDQIGGKEPSIRPPRDSTIHSNRSARADVGAACTVRGSWFDFGNNVELNMILTEILVAVWDMWECGWVKDTSAYFVCVWALCSRYLSNEVLLHWTRYSWLYSTHLLFLFPQQRMFGWNESSLPVSMHRDYCINEKVKLK